MPSRLFCMIAMMVATIWGSVQTLSVPGQDTLKSPPIATKAPSPNERKTPADDDGDEPVEEGEKAIIFREDRLSSSLLTRAAQLIADGKGAAAGDLLAEILSRNQHVFHRPTTSNPSTAVAARARMLIDILPHQGLAAYRLRTATNARRALERAVDKGGVDDFINLLRQFPKTSAADDATFLLGRRHVNEGRPQLASVYLRRLQAEKRSAGRFEPQLSLWLAVAELQAGDIEAARQAIAQLVAREPGSVRFAGDDLPTTTDASALLHWLMARLDESGGQRRRPVAWPGFRGGPKRLAAGVGDGLLAQPRWVCRFGDWMEEATALSQARELRNEYHNRNIAILPSTYPLAARGQIIFRVRSDVVGVDGTTGKIRWAAGLTDPAPVRRGSTTEDSASKASIDKTRALATRLWGDALAGQLSTDGQLVFAIEGQTVPTRSRSAMGLGGTSRSQASPSVANSLVALDLAGQGRRRWVIDGAAGIAGQEPRRTFFLGSPLALGERLYAIAEQEHKIRLLVFDAATGRFAWALHLADLDSQQALSRLRRVYGVSPSYARGILVCPTSAGAVVAVDVSSQSLLWGFKFTHPRQWHDVSLARGIAGAALVRLLEQQAPFERNSNGWCDEIAMIAEDRLLVTSPSDQKLRCLSLADGKPLWSYPPANPAPENERNPHSVDFERDALYVGGVVENKVVVVCRSRVLALRLDNGRPAWQSRAVELPPGGVAPSGRGVVSGNRFFLPLSNGQIATIDARHGRLVSLVGDDSSAAAGNLIALDENVISLELTKIVSYPQLRAAETAIAKTLKIAPRDTDAVLARAEILRIENKHLESVALLSELFRVSPEPRIEVALTRTMLELAITNPAEFFRLEPQLLKLVDKPHDRWRLLAQRVRSARSSGDATRAFGYLVAMDDVAAQRADAISQHMDVSNALAIDRRRWLRLQMDRTISSATDAPRAVIDSQIRTARDDALKASARAPLARFMNRFGWHPLAAAAGLRRSQELIADGEYLHAERVLVFLAKSTATATAAAAHRQLAEMYRASGRVNAAATRYRELASRFGDFYLTDGHTGKQIVERLPIDDPVRERLERRVKWPLGLPKVTHTDVAEQDKNTTSTIQLRPSLVIRGSNSPALEGRSLHYYYDNRRIAAHDRYGRLLWKATLDASVQLRIGYVPSVPLSYAHVREHLVLVVLGKTLLAIDCLNVNDDREARVLWRKDLSDALLSASSSMLLNWQWRRIRLGARKAGGALAFGRQATAEIGMNEDAVFYTHHRSLHAVDLLTGNTHWKRDNIVADSGLLVDRERVVIMPPDGGRSLVVRAVDGVALGYCQPPDEESHMATVGSNLLTWNTSPDAVRLALNDRWLKKTIWERKFHAQSVASLVGDQWVSVMQSDGLWKLLRMDNGEVLFERRLDAAPDLNLLHVFRDEDRTYVAVSSPQPPDSPLMIQVTVGGRKNPLVNGTVYAIDNRTGDLAWKTPVAGHGLLLNQPRGLPVIVLASSVYNRDEARRYSRMMCIDRRTGKILCDERGENSTFSRIEVVGDPTTSKVRIRSTGRSTTLSWK